MVQMKYFGNCRDYYKYDLITWVLRHSPLRNYVFVPMLTEHRDDAEGNLKPRAAEGKSAELFDFITRLGDSEKSLSHWERWLGNRVDQYRTLQPVDSFYFSHDSRGAYWSAFKPLAAQESALVFIDPDTGLETGTEAYMRQAGIEKYLLNEELKGIFDVLADSSVIMIYQHLTRDKNLHQAAVQKRIRQIQDEIPGACVSAIREDDLAFLFVSKEKRLDDSLKALLKDYDANSRHPFKSLHLPEESMTDNADSQELKLIESTIRSAGTLLGEIARRPLDILNSDGKDIKLQADRDSEELIIAALRAGSDYPILCEERGEIGASFDGLFWIIDPLDGTLNYSRGIPVCCVSIALVDGSNGVEKPVAGAVYDFNRDELFSAAAGQGAWLNGKPMRVSGVTDASQGAVSTGFPSSADFSTEGLLPLIRRVQQFKKVRMIGAAAVSLAWVACGRIDAYLEDDVMLWDIAAGVLLVSEAGGMAEVSGSSRKKWARNVKTASHPGIWSVRG